MDARIGSFVRMFLAAIAILGLVSLVSCGGGGGGSDSGSGTVSMNITDAKPTLPAGVEHVYVTIDGVLVHKSGGDWILLTLTHSPYEIDLLQYTSGNTATLVPPATLTTGHYTQVRLSVSSARMVTSSNDTIPLTIPSDSLKTDKTFDFQVTAGGGVVLTVDFDLSQSIVAAGSGAYQLKPVLHLIEANEAAKISGTIATTTFGNESTNNFATVLVTWDKDNSGTVTNGDEIYTSVRVDKPTSGNTATFDVNWLVPGQRYIVRIWIGDAPADPEAQGATQPVLTQVVGPVTAGTIYTLNPI